MRVVVLASGNAPSFALLKRECEKADVLICADGGANYFYRYAMLPHFIVGDLDSIDVKALQFFQSKNVTVDRHAKEKDSTDSHLALEKALSLGAKEIVFLGFLGNRIDHVFGNFGLLLMCKERGVVAAIKDDISTITLLDKPCKISGKKGGIFSLQAYGDVVLDLNILGSKFELQNYDLKIGDNLTLSNEFLEDGRDVSVYFKSGRLLLIVINV